MFRGMYRGSGQGGGGSVDYNRVVEKIAVIPSVETATVGKVYMYDGVSNANYTHGYIYECVATQTATAVSFSGNIVSNWAVADFVSYLQEGGSAYNEVTHGTLTYDESGGLWDLVGYDANGIQVMSFHEYTEDLEDFGCTFASATHQDGDSCNFTMTTEESGKKWKRLDVQPAGEGGGSGGDQHNLGWYATPEALRTAHATATAGDWAIVGSTDTVWIWDTDTSAWKDSDQKGQVASVNGQTGTVVLTASDVGAATAAQGALADTAVQPSAIADMETQTHASATYATKAELADKQDVIQYSTMPTASVDNVGDIVQFVGTTTASYTNGYFYKCVSDGATPAVYSWERVDAQPAPVIPDPLPDQTGQSGKFLTTNGSSASWSNKPLVNTYTGQYYALGILGTIGGTSTSGIAIGSGAEANATYSAVALGADSRVFSNASYGTAIGGGARAGQLGCTALGANSVATATCAIQIGTKTNGTGHTNNVSNTFKVGNDNGNFEMMSADGTIPAARHADTTNASQGDVLALDSNGKPVWQTTSAVDPHRVIDFQAPTSQNNYTWYRKYADGWVEQGGSYGSSQNQTISLPVGMTDNNYSVLLSFNTTSVNAPVYSSYAYNNKTTTSFVVMNPGSIDGDWQVCGMYA